MKPLRQSDASTGYTVVDTRSRRFWLFVIAVLMAGISTALTSLALVAGGVEAVPSSALLLDHGGALGYAAVRGAALAALGFLVFRDVLPVERWRTALAATAAGMYTVNAAWDVAAFAHGSVTTSTALGVGDAITAATVALVLVGVSSTSLVNHRLIPRARQRVDWNAVRAVAFSLLMITSVLTVVSFSATQPASAVEGDVEWTFTTGDQAGYGAVIYEDDLYVTSDDGNLYSLDPDTGDKNWNFTPDAGNVIAGSPTISDGNIIVNGDDMYAVDPTDGTEVWRAPDGYDADTSPISVDGTVYAGTTNGALAANGSDGSGIWTTGFGSTQVESQPTVYQDTVYVGDIDGGVHALNTTDGAEEWNYTVGGAVYSSPTTSNGTVYVSSDGIDGGIYALDADTGEKIWNRSADGSDIDSVTVSDGKVYAEDDSDLLALDADNGSKIWEYGGELVSGAPTIVNDTVYVSTWNTDSGGMAAVDAETGAAKWTQTGVMTSSAPRPIVYNGTVYAGSVDNTVYAFDTSHSLNSSGARIEYGTLGQIGPILTTPAIEDATISGKVIDQDGVGVSHATVEAWGINHAAVNESTIDDLEAEIDKIANKIENPLPPGWNEQGGLSFDVGDAYSTTDGRYPLVHHTSAWDSSPRSVSIINDGDELSDPTIQVAPGEPYEISVWDPTKESEGDGIVYRDPYDAQLPGASDSGIVTVERIGPGGSVVDSYQAATTENYASKAGRAKIPGVDGIQKKHETTGELVFQQGIYRIGLEDSNVEYYIISGSVNSLSSTIEQGLEDEKGELTNRAEYLKNQTQDNNITKVMTTTDADGNFSLQLGGEYDTVSVQAYQGAGLISSLESKNLSTLRSEVKEQDFNGSVYLPTTPTRIEDPPKTGVMVETHEVSSPSFGDIESILDKWDAIMDAIENENFEDLANIFGIPVNETADTLTDRYNATVGTIDGTPLETRFVEIAEEAGVSTTIDSSQPDEVLKEQISIYEQVIATEIPNTEENKDDEDSIEGLLFNTVTTDVTDDGHVTVTVKADNVDSVSDVSGFVTLDNGQTLTLDESQISYDGATVGSDEIVYEYQFRDGASAAVIEGIIIDETGNVVQISERVVNPQFDGELPLIESVNVNTLRPAVGDRVEVTVTPTEDGGFTNIDSATVYGPDGVSSTPTIDNQEISFNPDSEGEHTVALDLKSASGDIVTETVSIKAVAAGERVSMPPGIYIERGVIGEYAIAGDGVDSANIESDAGGAKKTVTGRFNGGQVPDSEIRVYGMQNQYSLQEYTIRVVDDTGSTISTPTRVVVHTKPIPDEAQVRIGGNPAVVGIGEVNHNTDATVIKTIVTDGEATVRLNTDPSIIDRIGYWIDVQVTQWGGGD